MKTYLSLLRDILDHGVIKDDRTNTGTISAFGRQVRFDLRQGFPLVTTKKMHWASIVHELLWFLRGDTNIAYLKENGVRIWNEWADNKGDLGPIYGKQWRCWPLPDGGGVDQIEQLIDQLRRQPHSRRLLVCAWNVGQLPQMRLWPCHVLFQCYVVDNVLSGQLYQRSADLFLGVPFNIASYALLLHLLARLSGLQVGEFIHSFGDIHIYNNHRQQVLQQLSRQPYTLPTLAIKAINNINTIRMDDIILSDYHYHPAIPAPIAV